jgi:hypothetical protein
MPAVSLPAEPASDLKHCVCAVILIGKLLSKVMALADVFVKVTSEVGINHHPFVV